MASFLTGNPSSAGQLLMSSSSTPFHDLGEKMFTDDGRAFRYAKAGGVALVPGTLLQAAAEDTSDQNLAVAAAAIGATSIATTTTVTVTANQYQYVMVTVTPGQGYMYKIKSHPAATAAALTITLEDALQVALTTSSRIDLVASPYNGVVINPSTATSAPVGVAVYPIAIGEYGWIQTSGPTCLLADGTVTVGTTLVASNATAGAVEAFTGVQAVVGEAMTGIATTEYGAVNLMLQ